MIMRIKQNKITIINSTLNLLKCCVLLTMIFSVFPIFSQIENPFRSIGKKGEIVTLSDGKFQEVHPYDSLQKIGSVIVNMNTGMIYKIIETDTMYSEATLDPTIISRWYSMDKVVKHNESPYASMSNNPVWFGDLDGNDTLIMNMTEVTSPRKDVMLWKVTFTFIQDNVEYNMTPEKAIYFGMPDYAWNKSGNTQPMNKLIRLYNETGATMAEEHSKEWNENVIHLKGGGHGQFFHPAVSMYQSIGCFLACDYPVEVINEYGAKDLNTGADMKATASKARLKDVKTVYNQASAVNNDPKLDYFVKFGAASSATLIYGQQKNEAIDPLPLKSAKEVMKSFEMKPLEIIPSNTQGN